MISSRITCGLGNQMFQYATGYALAKRAGLPHMLDTSWFRSTDHERKPHEEFILHHFTLDTPEAVMHPATVKEERSLIYQRLPSKPCHLVGYWQSERYFADVRDDLLEMFTPRVADTSVPADVAIHVRRGDKLTSRWIGIADEDYYDKAIAGFRRHLGNPTFAVWSDDPDWATEFFPAEFTVHPVGDAVGDLYAMSRCRHQIIANSTFSWWAAWLNTNPDKRIIWPDMVSRSHPPVSETDYIPASWKQP